MSEQLDLMPVAVGPEIIDVPHGEFDQVMAKLRSEGRWVMAMEAAEHGWRLEVSRIQGPCHASQTTGPGDGRPETNASAIR